MSAAALAVTLGTRAPASWETGRARPSPEETGRLCLALGCLPEALLGAPFELKGLGRETKDFLESFRMLRGEDREAVLDTLRAMLGAEADDVRMLARLPFLGPEGFSGETLPTGCPGAARAASRLAYPGIPFGAELVLEEGAAEDGECGVFRVREAWHLLLRRGAHLVCPPLPGVCVPLGACAPRSFRVRVLEKRACGSNVAFRV